MAQTNLHLNANDSAKRTASINSICADVLQTSDTTTELRSRKISLVRMLMFSFLVSALQHLLPLSSISKTQPAMVPISQLLSLLKLSLLASEARRNHANAASVKPCSQLALAVVARRMQLFCLQLESSCLQLSLFAYHSIGEMLAYSWSCFTYNWSFLLIAGASQLLSPKPLPN